MSAAHTGTPSFQGRACTPPEQGIYLFVDGAVAVPPGHRLQHAAQEAAVATSLVLRTAGHRVDDVREHLRGPEV